MENFFNHPLAVRESFRNGKGTVQKFNQIKRMWFVKILNLAVSRFDYTGLPDEIDQYFLESGLFFNGSMLMIRDNNIDMYAVTNYTLAGNLNIYQFPTLRYSYATPGYFKEYNQQDSVIIRDNPSMYPFAEEAWLYAGQLANIWLTRDINTYWQRTPKMVVYPEQQGIAVNNVIKNFNEYVPMIKVSEDFNVDMFKSIDISSPDVTESLTKQEKEVKTQILIDLGYSASANMKKERLVANEANQEQGEIFGMRNIGIKSRKRACNFINELWGLNVDVTFSSDFDSIAEQFLFYNQNVDVQEV